MRGGRRHFTFSKVMAWVALDRTVRDAERFKFSAPLESWRKVRDRMHATICERGFNSERNTFTQSYGSSELDASLLLIPLVGFLPADDPRVRGTVAAIERELLVDGLVLRYRTEAEIDGLAPEKACFSRAAFGLPTITSCSIGMPKHAPCSSVCYRCATMLACSRKNTTRRRSDNLAISRRHSRIPALIGTALSCTMSAPHSSGARERSSARELSLIPKKDFFDFALIGRTLRFIKGFGPKR